MKAVLKKVEDNNQTTKTFWFLTDRRVSFLAGQFTQITIKNIPDHQNQSRWFTISSAPEENLISITTKFSKNSSVFKEALKTLNIGDKVDLADPIGDFVLPKNNQTPLIFVAIGIGITPYVSIAKHLNITGQKRNIHLIYAVKHNSDIIFKNTLYKSNLDVTYLVASPDDDWHGEIGKVSADKVLSHSSKKTNPLIYISGPEPVVESLTKQLIAKGVQPTKIASDYFQGYLDF